jgi:hypothetical protein
VILWCDGLDFIVDIILNTEIDTAATMLNEAIASGAWELSISHPTKDGSAAAGDQGKFDSANIRSIGPFLLGVMIDRSPGHLILYVAVPRTGF